MPNLTMLDTPLASDHAGVVRCLPVIALVAWACAASGSPPVAQQQATRGAQLYVQACASCHDPGGGGSVPGPELTADLLVGYRRARPLFDYTRTAMPFDAPGTLSQNEYTTIVAYLVRSRGLVATTARLDSATIDTLQLTR